jgi:uncharacterized protein YfaP (DUF2135 family)
LRIPAFVVLAFACACLIAASPAAAAGGSAHAASSKGKRCKERRKKGARCKRHDGRRSSAPAGPRTVTLTWDSSADIDLQVFDINGHHSGLQGGSIVDGIAGATHSANDSDGFGPETFDDPSGRRVGYLACYISGPHANVTLTDSGNGGATYTAGLGPTDPSQSYSTSVGWGYLPIGAHC